MPDLVSSVVETQLKASREIVDIVKQLAQRAQDQSDSSAGPAIADTLSQLLAISASLRQNAEASAELTDDAK